MLFTVKHSSRSTGDVIAPTFEELCTYVCIGRQGKDRFACCRTYSNPRVDGFYFMTSRHKGESDVDVVARSIIFAIEEKLLSI